MKTPTAFPCGKQQKGTIGCILARAMGGVAVSYA